MSKKGILLLFFLFFAWFFLAVEVMADDLILSGSIGGYYYSDGDIYTQGTCLVQEGVSTAIVTLHTITFNPGFSVKLGGSLITKIDDSDSDNDGLPDWWEWENFEDFFEGSGDDPDMDELTNLQEYQNQTDPNDSDTDDDEMPDGWEFDNGTNPIQNDAVADLDEDLYSNYVEYVAGTEANDENSIPIPGYYQIYDALGWLIKTVYLVDYEIEYEVLYNYDSVGNRTSKEVR